MKQTAKYKERRKYEIYDGSHALLYLNEKTVTMRDEESEGEVAGYAYTGNMPDGGTLIEAIGVNDENRRGKFVAGVIALEYDLDAQVAMLANGADTAEHAAKMERFSAVRAEAKRMVDEMLSREL